MSLLSIGSGNVAMRDGTMEQHGPVDADVDVDGDTPGLKSPEVQEVVKDGPPREDGAGAAGDGAGSAGEGGVVKEKLEEADSELPRLAVVTACKDGAVKVSIEVVPKLADKEVPGQSEAADLPAVVLPVSGSPERSREHVSGSSDKVVAEEGPVLASGDGGGEECGGGLLEQVTSVEGVAGPAPAKASTSGEEELHAVHIPGSDGVQGSKEELQKANSSSAEAEVDVSNPIIDGKEEECKGGEATLSVLLKPEVAAMSDSDSDHAPITLRRTLKRTANRAVLVLQSDDEEKTSSDQDGSEHSSETVRYFEHEAEELTENFDSEAEDASRYIDSEAEESPPHFGDDDEFPSDYDKPRDTDSEDEGVDRMDDFIDDEAEESLGESDSEEEPTEDFDRETDRSSQDEEDAVDTDTMYVPDEDSAEVQTSIEMEDDDQRDVEVALHQGAVCVLDKKSCRAEDEFPLKVSGAPAEAATVRSDRLDARKAGEQAVFPEAQMDNAYSMGEDVQAIFDHEKRLHLLISRLLSSKAITADEADILRNYSRPRMVDAGVETDFPQTRPDSIGGTTFPYGAGVEEDVKKGPGVDSEDVTTVQTVQPESEQDVFDFAQKQCKIGGTVDKKRRTKVKGEQEAMLPPPGPVQEILEPKDLAEFFKKKKRIRRARIVESESDDNEVRWGADECDTIQPAEERALAIDRLTKRKKGKRTGAQRKPLELSMYSDLASDDEAGQADGGRNEEDPELAVMEGQVQAKKDDRDGESDERGDENDERAGESDERGGESDERVGESDERGGESDEKAVEKEEIRTSGRKKKRKTNVKQYDVAVPSDVEALVSEKVTKIKCDIGKMLRRSWELDQEGRPSEVEIDADFEKTSPQNNASNGQPAVGETATVGVELRTGKLRKRKRKEKSENCDGEGLGDFLHGKLKRKHAKRNKLVGEHLGDPANLDVSMEEVHADSASGLEKVELLNRAQEYSNDAARGKSKDRPKKKKSTGQDGSAELGIQDEEFVVSGLNMSVENHQESDRLVQMESSAVDLESELPLEISSKKQVDEEVGASSFVKKQRGKKKKSRKAKVSFSYQVSGAVSLVAEHTELDDADLGSNHPHGPSEPESATRDQIPSSKNAKKSKNGVQVTARARPDTEKGNEQVGKEEMTLDSIWRSYMSPEWSGHALPVARPEKLHGNRRTMVKDTRAEVPQPQRVIIPYSPVKMKKRKAPCKEKHGGIRSSVSKIGLFTREDDVDPGEDRQAVGKKRNKKKARTI